MSTTDWIWVVLTFVVVTAACAGALVLWQRRTERRKENERRQARERARERKTKYEASEYHCASCMTHLNRCQHVAATYRKHHAPRCHECGDPDLMFTANGAVYWRGDRWLCDACHSDEDLEKIPPRYNPFTGPTELERNLDQIGDALVELIEHAQGQGKRNG